DELILTWAADSGSGRPRRPSPFIAEALDLPAATPAMPDREARLQRLAALEGSPPAQAASARRVAPDGTLTLSFSALDDYLGCPARYRLRHVLGVPVPPHHALAYGTALHAAVAAFGQQRQKGRTMSEQELLDVFASHWSPEGFLSREHEEARFDAGREALRRFHAAQLAEGAPVPAGVEEGFSFELDGVRLRGRFDRVDETAAGVVITDFKSSDVRDPLKAKARARDSLQLAIYALAHEAATGTLPAAVQLHFLDSGLVGRVAPEPARLAKARQRIARAAEGIGAGEFAATPDQLGCGYCPFRDICPDSAAR
ncbi:MAG TPA: PD-(D/E)XK nuclease family protein, partial [Candidatus Limnocylindrales bacterium]|nr:PD-(D/E)XK nuclease family protein [Candidatus Limnocylindrales bacterium]